MATWFNKMRAAMSVTGLPFEGRKYTFKPLIKKASVATCTCPKCEYKTSTLWLANEDVHVLASLCPKCKKFEVRRRGAGRKTTEVPANGRCLATTSRGNRCKNKANKDGFCTMHSPKNAPQVVDNGDGSASIHGKTVGLGI